jgi:hypothetical protein
MNGSPPTVTKKVVRCLCAFSCRFNGDLFAIQPTAGEISTRLSGRVVPAASMRYRATLFRSSMSALSDAIGAGADGRVDPAALQITVDEVAGDRWRTQG